MATPGLRQTRSITVDEVRARLLERNRISRPLFEREAATLALACRAMADRFHGGGRLLAFGRGAWATDAQHVAVEFVHPVIVGKRALPALDLSASFPSSLSALVGERDIVMGFGPPGGDQQVVEAVAAARDVGALTFSFAGGSADYTLARASDSAFVHQEMVELLYHMLWETVHVFFERRERGHDVGQAGFLYPFLGREALDDAGVVEDVADSIRSKAREDERLREAVARYHAEEVATACQALRESRERGARLLLFGNGGSATDANDWALDCLEIVDGARAMPAVSLASEPAILTALANDVGVETIFLRQVIAQGRAGDVAVGISTSGGSANVIAALVEARKRGLATLALLGYDGGEIVRRNLADWPIVVPSDYVPRIQEVQASIYHVITEVLRES